MSKLDLIRAGHTEVADGQCWLCDVPWPCDTGVVLAALTAAEARAEQAERERDAADEEAQNARSVAQMAASDRDEAMDNFDNLSLELERLEKQLTADNAALRERLATVEAALIRLRAGCMVSAGTACRLCHGTWLREDGETAADHHDGCPLRETAPGAALAATPAAVPDEIILPALETRIGVGTVVSVSVRPDLVLDDSAATPVAEEVE